MTPLPAGVMRRSAARVARMVPFRVMSRTFVHCSSVMSTSGDLAAEARRC